MILLVGIIAAIALTLRQRKDTKYTDPSQQVRVHARDRRNLIKMPPTVATPRAGTAETKA